MTPDLRDQSRLQGFRARGCVSPRAQVGRSSRPQLAQVSMSFVDTVMAGRVSAQGLAAVAVGVSLWMPISVFGMGVLMSISPTAFHTYSAGKHDEIGQQVRQGLWLAVVVGLVSLAAVRSCSPLVRWLEIDPEIVPTTTGFLDAISWGVPGLSAFIVLRGFSEAVSKTRPMLAISILGLLANIAGNYVFIHGEFGLSRLGAVGCWRGFGALVMWIIPREPGGLDPVRSILPPFRTVQPLRTARPAAALGAGEAGGADRSVRVYGMQHVCHRVAIHGPTGSSYSGRPSDSAKRGVGHVHGAAGDFGRDLSPRGTGNGATRRERRPP